MRRTFAAALCIIFLSAGTAPLVAQVHHQLGDLPTPAQLAVHQKQKGKPAPGGPGEGVAPVVPGGEGAEGVAPVPESVIGPDTGLTEEFLDFESPFEGTVTESGLSSLFPNMIGDMFAGGTSQAILVNRIIYTPTARGDLIAPGSFAYEVGLDTPANDFFSVGPGIDTDGNGIIDSYQISEPVPPTDAATSPGPTFVFDGGLATVSNPTNLPPGTGEDWLVNYSFSESIVIKLPIGGVASGGGGGALVGRPKISENNSPIPRDRVYFNYSMFDNVPLTSRGVTVNRCTPGFEKTFFQQMMSLEVRAPFAGTLSSDLQVDGPNDLSNIEFGDVFLAGKVLIMQRRNWALTGGLAVTIPTADDLGVFLADGRELLRVKNQTVHLTPFVGFLAARGNFFVQGFVEVDIDTNGNPVYVNAGDGLVRGGRMQDPAFFEFDLGAGYWLRPRCCGGWGSVTGISPIVELHYHRSLNDSDILNSNGFSIGPSLRDIQILDAVVGGTVEFGRRNHFTVGYATPVGNGSDQLFDGELRAFWNRFF